MCIPVAASGAASPACDAAGFSIGATRGSGAEHPRLSRTSPEFAGSVARTIAVARLVWPPELDLRAEHLALRQRGVRPPQSAAPPEGVHGASLPHIGDGRSVKDQGATPSSVDARSSDVAPSAQGGEQHPSSGLDRVRGGSVAGKAQQRHMGAPVAGARFGTTAGRTGRTIGRGTPRAPRLEKVVGNDLLQPYLDRHLAALPRTPARRFLYILPGNLRAAP